jgi:hypothetical protein
VSEDSLIRVVLFSFLAVIMGLGLMAGAAGMLTYAQLAGVCP